MEQGSGARGPLLANLDLEAARRYWPTFTPAARADEAADWDGARDKLLIFDDDPTGTQTAHDVDVIARPTPEAFREAFADPRYVTFVLTNSRALPAPEAQELYATLARWAYEASALAKRPFEILCRGDSTLRGHYPLENLAVQKTLERESGRPLDGELLIPAFLAAGRLTFDAFHYVLENGRLVPVGATEFARDATFGYSSSDLRDYVEEKTCGRTPAAEVRPIGLDVLRGRGAQGVVDLLGAGCDSGVGFRTFVADAVENEDLEILAQGLRLARGRGMRILLRTAASFVSAYGKMKPRPLLRSGEYGLGAQELPPERAGLVVVGSHVPKSTRQLRALLELPGTAPVELPVASLLETPSMDADASLADSLATRVDAALVAGLVPVLYTSRELLRPAGGDGEATLRFSVRVSRILVDAVRAIRERPRWVVAKGGITSSDIAVHGFEAIKAQVLGQALPGVPVWRLGPESRSPGLDYVIFPGNVGGEDDLATLVKNLIGSKAL